MSQNSLTADSENTSAASNKNLKSATQVDEQLGWFIDFGRPDVSFGKEERIIKGMT